MVEGYTFRRMVAKTWQVVLDQDRHVYDVTIDPTDPNVLYAAGFESSAWRSADRGRHWTRIQDLISRWRHRVIPDPLRSRRDLRYDISAEACWHGSIRGQKQAAGYCHARASTRAVNMRRES